MSVLDPSRGTLSDGTLLVQSESVVAPQSFAQERLWMLDQMRPGSSMYNVRRAYRLEGPLDVAALQASLADIVRRHEIFRTTFSAAAGEPVQHIVPDQGFEIAIFASEHLGPDEREHEIARFVREQGALGFNLATGPLLRAAILRLHAREHILVFVMHHIVTDAWSAGIFARELMKLYEAHHFGWFAALPELPIQYADFAAWQREELQGEKLSRLLEYWREQLADVPQPLEIPSDHPRSLGTGHAGATERIVLSEQLTQRLRAFARAQGATLFMTALAAFQAMLYRYTGQKDIIVGSPTANRLQPELEPLIGFFVNMLPLRVNVHGTMTFAELLRQVRLITLTAYEHQELPFEKLVAEVQPERSLSETPLFSTVFQVQAKREDHFTLADLTVSPIRLENPQAKFDLMFTVAERSDDLECFVVYRSDLFKRERIVDMLSHFENILSAVVLAPEMPIAKIPMLSAAELEHLLVTLNSTERPFPQHRTLAQLFEAQVKETPDAIALGHDGTNLSYAELNATANRVTAFLRSRNIVAGQMVGLCMERSIPFVICTLAVLKLGCTYLPLDPEYPAERIAHMLADSDVRIVFTQEKFLAALQNATPIVEPVVYDMLELDDQDVVNPDPVGSAESVAYIMYTSGSTGAPKGVMVTQRGIVRLIKGTQYIVVTKDDRVAHIANVCFDAATFEIWTALLNGARLEIAKRETVLQAENLHAWLQARHITIALLTTALFRMVSQHRPQAFAQLTYLLVGGEALDAVSVDKVFAAGAPAHLINAYGPTEDTVIACTHEVRLPLGEAIPIGRPIANTQAYILDGDLQVLPRGCPGQLYLGGPGLAKGYLGNPELTAERFINHPFAEDPEQRLYATGDLVRLDANDEIEYLGRNDRQVKLRGFRIEIGEIENTLRRQRSVRDALVISHTEPSGEQQLIGYVVDDAATLRTSTEWRRLLADHLPRYMVPSTIVSVREFTLTRNGKIDMTALPKPETVVAESESTALRHTNPLYYQLSAFWEPFLGTAQIKPDDDFFDLGGHSLLAARMIAALELEMGRAVPLSVFLEDPTIEHLAHILVTMHERDAQSLTVLQPNGDLPPFIFLHGDFRGGGYYTRKIAAYLDPNQPFYVFAPHGVVGAPFPLSIEEMAVEYVDLLKAVRPVGPYILGGFCSSALVALEMARRLRAQGDVVLDVLMIDPSGENARISGFAGAMQKLLAAVRIPFASRVRAREACARFYVKWRRFARRVRVVVQQRRAGEIYGWTKRKFAKNDEPVLDDGLLELAWRGHSWNYIPEKYRGRATVLLPVSETRFQATLNRLGWKNVITDLHAVPLSGTHLTCITSHVADTAMRIGDALQLSSVNEVPS